ncbi:MAG: OsmC family protein [Rhodospirillaceae bacterium]|nr:OsmC family protein [Rhodospirillaceae bacterium]
MSDHKTIVEWAKPTPDFLKGRYSREHTWSFDGGATVLASSSPSIVPVPLSNPAGVDPEEGFIAAISSCHMLTFLDLARRKGFAVERYRDEAVGHMAKNAEGVMWVSEVILNPQIAYTGEKQPTQAEVDELHHAAHKLCFIGNSVKTDVKVAPAR